MARVITDNKQAKMLADTTWQEMCILIQCIDPGPLYLAFDGGDRNGKNQLDGGVDAVGNPSSGLTLTNNSPILVIFSMAGMIWGRTSAAQTRVEVTTIPICAKKRV